MELKVTRHGAASQVAVLHPGAQVDGRSAFQFEQDVLRQRVDRFASAIQPEHNDPVVAGFRFPMLEAQSIEASDHAAPSDTVRGGGYHPGRVCLASMVPPLRCRERTL